ncbi:cytochrome P450 [Apiospora hydei]|uniref:Cytochrome P450 n=1 Tax=Apiospora hydei TaxID=1337664 RepID=A0ABR1XA22_9PEZI
MRLGPISMYLIFGAENVQAIFRNSRSLSFEFMQLRIAEKVKGLPQSDKLKLGLDDSGSGSVPLNDQRGDERIWHNLHSIYLKNLTERSAVDFLTHKFAAEFAKQLDSLPWAQSTTGLYAFLQRYQFNASTITLVGPRILNYGKDAENKAENQLQFSGTFWEYDAAFMTLMQGMPRFMCRKGWAARDRTLEATKVWLREATEASEAATAASDKDPEWDENFGHRLVRERNAELVRYGISFDGRAAMHMGLIWAINANAVPMTAYVLFELVRDPALLQRVRSEIRAGGLPLLGSVYSECLRMRSSIPISRRLREDVVIDGYTLKKDSFLLAPSWLSHMNEEVWAPRSSVSPGSSSGNGISKGKGGGHIPGAHEFWAERFLHLEASKTKIKLGTTAPTAAAASSARAASSPSTRSWPRSRWFSRVLDPELSLRQTTDLALGVESPGGVDPTRDLIRAKDVLLIKLSCRPAVNTAPAQNPGSRIPSVLVGVPSTPDHRIHIHRTPVPERKSILMKRHRLPTLTPTSPSASSSVPQHQHNVPPRARTSYDSAPRPAPRYPAPGTPSPPTSRSAAAPRADMVVRRPAAWVSTVMSKAVLAEPTMRTDWVRSGEVRVSPGRLLYLRVATT